MSSMRIAQKTLNWETELVALLNTLSATQEELLDVLEQKREAMATRDRNTMLALQPREEELASRLQAVLDRRTDLLSQATANGWDVDNLNSLAERLGVGESPQLASMIETTSQNAKRLQQKTITNWVVAQKSLLHLSQLLEIIATGGRTTPTYGKDTHPRSSGGLVDEAA